MGRFIMIDMRCMPDWLFQVREWTYDGLISAEQYIQIKMWLVDNDIIKHCIETIW